MKKILLGILVVVSMGSSAFGANLMLNGTNVDKLGLLGLEKKLDKLDSGEVGLWYLYHANYSKWKQVHEDEFELDDAKQTAYKAMLKEIKESKNLLKKQFEIRLNIKFKKFNFKKGGFPIEAFSKNSYLYYEGEKLIDILFIDFDNVVEKDNFLPMKKSDAKAFIKAHKNRYGDVDRRLLGRYTIEFKKIDSNDRKIFGHYCSTIDKSGYESKICSKAKAHILKFEIVDKNGDILHAYTYK